MEFDRAREIIQALADGVDPYTGENFPADGPYPFTGRRVSDGSVESARPLRSSLIQLVRNLSGNWAPFWAPFILNLSVSDQFACSSLLVTHPPKAVEKNKKNRR